MKFNKYLLVSILLLTIITIGAASAASDNAAADGAVAATEDAVISSSDDSQIIAAGDDVASSNDANDYSKLGASAGDEKLAAGSVTPNYTVEVTPNATDAGNNYIAQYGQIITVKGAIENASGNVSIRFGYSGNYHDFTVPLENGKFTQEITCYDRVRNNYQIQVKWAGDDYYKAISWSKNIHVQMENVTANGAYYGLTPYMDVDLFDATGNVTFYLNGRNYTAKLVDGKVVQEFTNYTIGKNPITMVYSGDERFNSIERSFNFNVDANVDARTIYNYEPAIVTVNLGSATGKVNITLVNGTQVIESHELDIVNKQVSTEIKNYYIGNNTLEISYSGDDTFNPFKTTYLLEVLDKEDAEIISSVYQTGSKNFIFITIPHATGTINVTVNGKKEVWELVNETVIKNISATDKINELIVSYEGNVRLNPTTSSFYVNLTDYIVNAKTWKNYFNLNDDGRLFDFLDDGITLDFQGSIINPDSKNEMNMILSKPVNVISSTGDAYIDLNCTAGSLLGEHPGSSFVVNHEGSGSNITGIYLHNTELWISNTTNVVFDNISVVVEDQRVGSGVGATSVRDNSSYVTLKNSYFYTRNNGGSTTFTFSWANNCVFDNNTVKAEGNVGNLLYLNVYNIKNLPEPTKTSWGDVLPDYPLNNHNTFSNNVLYGKEGSGISVGIMVEGEYNLIANNTLHKCSISTSFGGTGANNNTYYGNVLEEGSSLTAQAYSIIFNNTVPGSITTGTGSYAHDNVAGTTMTVTAGSVAHDNIVGKTMTVAAGSEAYNNVVNGLTVNGANAVAHDNLVNGTTTVSGANSKVYYNELTGDVKVTGAGAVVAHNLINNGTTTVSGKNTMIEDNIIDGDVSVASTNITLIENDILGSVVFTSAAGNCNILNNVINSTDEYAIDLGTSKNNIVKGNIVSSANATGKDAINNNDPSNIIEDYVGLDVYANDMLADQNETVIYVDLNANATGLIYVYINDELYKIENDGGHNPITLYKKFCDPGMYYVVAVYEGDTNFVADHASTSFIVDYYGGLFDINVSDAKAGEDVVITTTLLCKNNLSTILNPRYDLSVIVDGVGYIVPFESNNTAVLILSNVSAGNHTIIASYGGDGEIYPCEALSTFTLEKVIPTVDLVVDDLKLGESANVTVTIANATGKVNIIVDGVENLVDLVDGVATYTIEYVTSGHHTIVANYVGDDKFNAAFATASDDVIVISTEISDVTVSGDLNITATLINIIGAGVANATITYTIGNITNTTTTDANGSFSIQAVGGEKITIDYDGDDLFLPSTLSLTLNDIVPELVESHFNITGGVITLKGYAVDTKAGEEGMSYATELLDSEGKPISGVKIQFAVNDKIYGRTTDEKGSFTPYKLNMVRAGRYTMAFYFAGDENYTSAFGSVCVDLDKKPITISASAKTYKASATKSYTVTLSTKACSSADGKAHLSSGKKVTLTVNGKTYSGKTNAKGQVTFKLTNLSKKGTYTAKIDFAGDNTYESATKSVKITIN